MAHNISIDNIDELLANGKPLMLDFSASWCGPCKRLAPIVDALDEKYADQVIIGKIDIEEEEDLATKYGIRNVPTILFIKDNTIVDKQAIKLGSILSFESSYLEYTFK